MAVQNKVLYGFRGWIAFVAFVDLCTAGRSYIEKRSFLTLNESKMDTDIFTTSRMLGMYSFLKSLALIHCALYIHYRPVVSMGYWSLCLTIMLYLSEAFYYQTTAINFHIIFPCVLNVITLLGLIYLPSKLKIWSTIPGVSGLVREVEDENTQILKQMGNFRRRPKNKQI